VCGCVQGKTAQQLVGQGASDECMQAVARLPRVYAALKRLVVAQQSKEVEVLAGALLRLRAHLPVAAAEAVAQWPLALTAGDEALEVCLLLCQPEMCILSLAAWIITRSQPCARAYQDLCSMCCSAMLRRSSALTRRKSIQVTAGFLEHLQAVKLCACADQQLPGCGGAASACTAWQAGAAGCCHSARYLCCLGGSASCQ
jgi:hypothetical protein